MYTYIQHTYIHTYDVLRIWKDHLYLWIHIDREAVLISVLYADGVALEAENVGNLQMGTYRLHSVCE